MTARAAEMRGFALLLLAATLASCAAPEPYRQSPQAQQDLQRLLAGKIAGKPISCLQTTYTDDMQIIDGRNVAFKQGSRAVYLMRLTEGCHLLGAGGYALLSHQFGGMGYCQGDIARVLDTTSRMTVGSCGIEQIVPYTVAGARAY
jgi:Family of unknown function (DUF6491)